MLVPTEEIVFEYVKSYVQEHANNRQLSLFRDAANLVNINGQIEYKREVCQSLSQLSEELREFILNDHQERFNEMLTTVGNSNPSYQDFKTIGDELFSDGVSWYKVVTFLIFGAELICGTIDKPTQSRRRQRKRSDQEKGGEEENVEQDSQQELSSANSHEEVVTHTLKCLTRYINENLMQWISKQEDGWMSIKQYTLDSGHTNGMRYYFRMATLAAFVGGLYFCSKFILQK